MSACRSIASGALALAIVVTGSASIPQVFGQQPEVGRLSRDEQLRLARLTSQIVEAGAAQATADDLVDYYFLSQKLKPEESAAGIDNFSAELMRWWAADRQLDSNTAIAALLKAAQMRHAAAAAGFDQQLQRVFARPDDVAPAGGRFNPPSFIPSGARMLTRYLQFGHPRLGPIAKNGMTRLSNGAIDVPRPRR